VVRSFEDSGRNKSITRDSNPENLLPQRENGFVTDTAKVAVDKAETFPLD